jgi:hypothetical protein
MHANAIPCDRDAFHPALCAHRARWTFTIGGMSGPFHKQSLFVGPALRATKRRLWEVVDEAPPSSLPGWALVGHA